MIKPNRLLVDSHLDLAWNAVQWNRDLTQSVADIRATEVGMSGKGRAEGTVALPELRDAGIALAFVTTLARCTGTRVPNLDFSHPSQSFAVARGHAAYYQALERTGQGALIHTRARLEQHLSAVELWRQDKSGKVDYPGLGMALCMESADPILSPDELDEWAELGVWMIGPAHYGPGRYSGGTGSDLGFTPEGFQLLERMAELGMTLDITHLSCRAFDEALDQFSGPVLASHNNCRHLVDHQRQFDDRQIKALIERDAVIGLAFDAWMMVPGWVKGESSNATLKIERILDHADHICQLAGNCDHIGIGSDLDGGFGRSQSPGDLDTIADLTRLADLLANRGYTEQQIDAIYSGNMLSALCRSLK